MPAAATLREVVKVLSQSEGLDQRPLVIREQPLVWGVGSDIQAFGYDESAAAEPEACADGGIGRQDVESLPAGIVPERR